MIGILVVLLIASLMIGQTAEAFTCSSEIVTVDTAVSTNVVASDTQNADPSHGKSSGLCQHGHCHQSLRIMEPIALSDPKDLAAEVPATAREAAIADGRIYTIDYPPRA